MMDSPPATVEEIIDRWKNWSAPPTFGKLKETQLVKHLIHIPTDKDKIMEMEKYRISMRHLAVMMGKNPDEFTFEDQQKAIRYLMPGYFHLASWKPNQLE